MLARTITLSVSLMLFAACREAYKERELAERLNQVSLKEKELAQKEDSLRAREAALRTREVRLDSLLTSRDSVRTVHPEVVGAWTVTMKCTETSCPGSAIGDQKTEQWTVRYEADRVVVDAISSNKQQRTFHGAFHDAQLTLAVQKSTAMVADITIKLTLSKPNKLEGVREVVQQDGCKVLYAMEVQKI